QNHTTRPLLTDNNHKGGEMSTSRSPNDPSCTVDLGAQYISAAPYYARIHNERSCRHISGAEVLYERHVTHIHQKDTGWEVCHKAGAPDRFDIVVVTMPVPQILQLQGDVESFKWVMITT
uniref:Renalase, FAD-dependent amine oxidase n=1 Tax=Cyprinus carpio TaxID=7962 RepID=A0A8C1S2R7_CYPCA